MFDKLKQRWGVKASDLALIICTFALGGSLCGYLGRQLLSATGLEKSVLWVVLYIIIVTLLWPVCVLLISIPFFQFSFFKRYLLKMWQRMSGNNKKTMQVAIFASGAGSNAQKIIEKFNTGSASSIKISLIVCNKSGAGVHDIAQKAGIDTLLINKEQFINGDGYIPILQQKGIDFIVLAGFLWKIPLQLVKAYPYKIINIHPALLPKFGGKGMYGSKVHEAVIAAGEAKSGITIHYVDELYDHGNIIFQVTCAIDSTDTAETLAQKIHALEHAHFPEVIERLLLNAK